MQESNKRKFAWRAKANKNVFVCRRNIGQPTSRCMPSTGQLTNAYNLPWLLSSRRRPPHRSTLRYRTFHQLQTTGQASLPHPPQQLGHGSPPLRGHKLPLPRSKQLNSRCHSRASQPSSRPIKTLRRDEGTADVAAIILNSAGLVKAIDLDSITKKSGVG